jgi:hypothetical protein
MARVRKPRRRLLRNAAKVVGPVAWLDGTWDTIFVAVLLSSATLHPSLSEHLFLRGHWNSSRLYQMLDPFEFVLKLGFKTPSVDFGGVDALDHGS